MATAAPTHVMNRHVYACASNDRVVFLDLKTGRYLGLDRRASHALAPHVAGWPLPSSESHASMAEPALLA